MDQLQIAKQMMEFNKTAFDNSFNAMLALQDQTEKLVTSFMEKAAWFPEEGKKALNDWIVNYKKGRDEFKTAADENYRKVAEYFMQTEKRATVKTGKK